MMIIGVDYHPSFQQIAFLDQETGECGERPLNHSDEEAEIASSLTSNTATCLRRLPSRYASRRFPLSGPSLNFRTNAASSWRLPS
jgi:hypothetical protein